MSLVRAEEDALEFTWIQEMLGATPEDYQPPVEPAKESERLVGPLAADMARCYAAVRWSFEQARAKKEAHSTRHDAPDFQDSECDTHATEMSDLRKRVTVLSSVLDREVHRRFGLTDADSVEFRTEGLVVLPSEPEDDGESGLEDVLRGRGFVQVKDGDIGRLLEALDAGTDAGDPEPPKEGLMSRLFGGRKSDRDQ